MTVAVTELSRAGTDPEALQPLLQRAREIVERHGGSMQYGGNSLTSVFGVPVVHEDDPARAARSAAELRDVLADIEPRTGIATPLTGFPVQFTDATATPVPIIGTDFGFDFDPTADRIRVVTDGGFNFRMAPNTGAGLQRYRR